MQFEVKINSPEDGELTPEGKSIATASVNIKGGLQSITSAFCGLMEQNELVREVVLTAAKAYETNNPNYYNATMSALKIKMDALEKAPDPVVEQKSVIDGEGDE